MKLLETLTQTPAIAGREHRLRDLIQEHANGLFDEVRTDPLGSLICHRKPRPARGAAGRGRPRRVMLAAHMDQIGFMVRHIESSGFLRLQAVGGFDCRNLFARLVTVCPDVADPARDLPGVLNPSGPPVHVASPEDRKKIPEIGDLVVDTGLPAQAVRKRVRIGDMVVIRAPFTRVGNTVVGQCLDNRVACWVVLRALQKLRRHACDIHAVFTVQEEVGCRGAGPAADAIQPDVAISIDTTLCVDTPGVSEDRRVSSQGAGAGLLVMDSMSISDLTVLEQFESVARRKKIKAQRTILPRGGNDAAAIQRKAAGFRVMAVVCPTRYIHTVTEMVHLDDLHATRDLLAAWLAEAR